MIACEEPGPSENHFNLDAFHRTEKGLKWSEGSRLMFVAIEVRGWSIEDLTRAAGWARGMAIRFIYGDSTPGRKHAGTILRIFGIAPEKFDEAPTEDYVLPGARDAALPTGT